MLAAGCGSAQSSPAVPAAKGAELVLVGGHVMTGDPARGSDQADATAIAVRDDRIVYVGDDAGARAMAGSATRVVELHGRGVTAGLVDTHAHLYGLGAAREMLDLNDQDSPDRAVAMVAKAVAGRAAGEWITGRGWDQNRWADKEFPHHRLLDAVAPQHPVSLRRVDGHALWANAAAMREAGVSKATADPPGGRIVRDADGQPTGVFVDNAMGLIEAHIPAPAADVIERRIRTAAAEAIANGLTGVDEMGIGKETIAAYRRLAAAGQLPLRVYAFVAGGSETAATIAQHAPPELHPAPDAMFVLRGVKLYADGALGSRGAALLAPYSDAPELTGNWVLSPAELRAATAVSVEAGWQVATHAIGDAANRAVLDAYEASGAGPEARLRVEHAQVLAPADIPRFAKLGVIASMQPTHATSDMPWAEARLGPERIRGAYAWRSILDTGAHLAAGSDFPVEKVSPILGLYAATTRQDARGEPSGGWYPDQRMTLAEAVTAFTREAAYASFAEDRRGIIRTGFQADLTVYDRKLSSGAPLLDTRVDMTIVGGRVVYERK